MRALIQRVTQAKVEIIGESESEIGQGLVMLLSIEDEDSQEDITWLVQKISKMRIFSDASGKMDASILDLQRELLIVSQFTLHASTKKGNRPSFIKAARPEIAIPIYEKFVAQCEEILLVKTGRFGTDMRVSLVNDGPVTIWLDSKTRE
ncbi:MAG: D-aminoacyl-tRNA deacylase [Bacteroidia bacterium]|jgi:D-tyrosyl-tRNA(Tyr) deacylase|nr:D-aminoacyl-tRNA deacylase [Bacteroidia bacterium]